MPTRISPRPALQVRPGYGEVLLTSSQRQERHAEHKMLIRIISRARFLGGVQRVRGCQEG
jgi:hypothetical protein